MKTALALFFALSSPAFAEDMVAHDVAPVFSVSPPPVLTLTHTSSADDDDIIVHGEVQPLSHPPGSEFETQGFSQTFTFAQDSVGVEGQKREEYRLNIDRFFPRELGPLIPEVGYMTIKDIGGNREGPRAGGLHAGMLRWSWHGRDPE